MSTIGLKSVHHLAIVCSNYAVSKAFYTEVLGFEIIRETFRSERQSYKLDLSLNGHYCIELFSFPNPPTRPSYPEACGLRHLAFEVEDLAQSIAALEHKGIVCQAVERDGLTGKLFTFFEDPDHLPIELYSV